MSIDTKKENKLITSDKSEVYWSGNTTPTNMSIETLFRLNEYKNSFNFRYRIYAGGFDLLLKIAVKWEKYKIGSTVYGLSEGVVGRRTGIRQNVLLLLKKGLIEVVGSGRYGCSVYAPSLLGLSELNKIVKD